MKTPSYKWALRPRFRTNALGWLGSKLAIERLKEAVGEIKAVARTAPETAAEGAILLMERLWPARQAVDSSSGALGNATNKTVQVIIGILLAAGCNEEAYRRFAYTANRRGSHLATFRAISKKYPDKAPRTILDDLIAQTPGEEGKWFATAKDLGLLDLARRSPVDIGTLLRAAETLDRVESTRGLIRALAQDPNTHVFVREHVLHGTSYVPRG